MTGPLGGYSAAMVGVSVLVLAIGLVVAGPQGEAGVMVGVVLGAGFQVGLMWFLAGLLFPARRMLVYGLTMLGRLLLVVIVAVAAVPALDLAPMATLFSLLAVLFAAMLLEPVFFHSDSSSRS